MKDTDITRIYTHAGQFHADEILGIAIISQVQGFRPEVVRTFKPPEPGPNEMVLDIGERCDHFKWLDHHHDSTLPAACILALCWVENLGLVRVDVAQLLEDRLFSRVDKIDRGVIPDGGDPWEFNGLVRSFNGKPEGFYKALSMAETIVGNLLIDCQQQIEDEETWGELTDKFASPVVYWEGRPLLGWKELALRDGYFGMITPNTRGGWQIISADYEKYPIPLDDRQSYRHKSGFMAVYKHRDDAWQHALQLWGCPNPSHENSILLRGYCNYCQ